MKRYRKTTALIAATAFAIGATAALGSTDGSDGEKVKPAAAPQPQPQATTASYPTLLAEGAADGVPYGLRLMGVSEKEVQLSWLSPEPTNGYFEDFESHDDFTINSAGSIGWQYIDGDNANTYTWQACTFAGMGQKMAFIVMNPSQTTPATDGNPNFKPYSGEKMLVDFCAINAVNNDYIVSPALDFGEPFKVSFRARSYTENYNLERVRVGYSTTGIRQSDFTWVNEGDYIELPAAWTLVEHEMPAEARYVTINCVSDDAFMLLIDDIFIGTNNVRPGIKARALAPADGARLIGFNLYRDGIKVNDGLITEVRHTDTVDDYGTYTYAVTAVYDDDTETEPSEPITVDVPDTRLLPFEDDFDDWTMDADSWTTVNEDGLTENNWGISYYATGLVDPCATYGFSSQTNYDQSLLSRELNTTDPDGTYLRFNLRLQQARIVNTDYLDVELTTDDGETWQTLLSFDNTGGAFDWRVCQVALGSHLNGNNIFRIRFRAHGTTATYIDYWYMDDIKVWVPEFTTATLNVTSANGAVASCPVKLTADHGAVIERLTDGNGAVELPAVEKGTYTVEITRNGNNPFCGTWEIGDEPNSFTAQLTSPVVRLSESVIEADMATESTLTRTITMTNDGDGPLTWYASTTPTATSASDARRWEDVTAFNASGDLQSSVVFDGENYYTSSYTEVGTFWKYDRNGNLLERFMMPGLYMPIYDLTYDGRYFYASDGNNYLYKLDLANKRIADTITVAEEPSMTIMHCSWDPDRQGFWVGGSSTIALVNAAGTLMARLSYIDSSTSMSIIGSAYDNTTPGGPYLWLADGVRTSEMVDGVLLRQYDLNTRSLTGVQHRTTDVPGYMIGNSTYGTNAIGGIFTTFDATDGRLTLIGILQQSPSLIFSYTLCDVDSWLSLSPKHGTLQAGESQEITVGLNTMEASLGDELSATATIMPLPEVGDKSVDFSISVTSATAVPRPAALTASAGTASVELSWQPGTPEATAATATGYDVYRNGSKVNAKPVASTSYTDTRLVYGNYAYKVKAVYPDGAESAFSDSVNAFVKQGAPYYPPTSVAATIEANRDVALTWASPLANADADTVATWSSGVHANQLGISEGGYFYAASAWEATDLVPFRNRVIRSVSVMLVNPCTYLQLRIYKDGESIYRKRYDGAMTYDGTFTEVALDEELTVEPGCDYYFAFMLMNSSGLMPLALDGTAAVEGKGNLLSMDGESWFPASYQGISGNFNINVNFGAATAAAEEAPTGYNVYRDGQLANAEPIAATAWTEQLDEPGTHSYTLTSVYADGGESAMSDAATVSVLNIGERLAPTAIGTSTHINRDVTLRWNYPGDDGSGIQADLDTRPISDDASLPEFVRTFEGTNINTEMAVASDNRYIYTSVYAEDGRINKYSLTGELLETFVIDGLDGVRNLAWDGECFYAADNLTYIHRIDMDSHELLESIPISEYGRHIAYIPELNGGQGGFEVGDWETSIFVAKNGSKLGDGPSYLGAAGTGYHDGRIYAFEQGGDNTVTIGVYDFGTSQRIDSIDISRYSEIGSTADFSAGGMSVIEREDGVAVLALAMQSTTGYTRFLFLELSSVTGAVGYNVFRDGQQLNGEPLAARHFAESLADEGTYRYAVQTVYADGTLSGLSEPVPVTIVPHGTAPMPAHVKAAPSSYGYNVLVSFADPAMYDAADSHDDFESLTDGQDIADAAIAASSEGWTATAARSYDGTLAMTAATADDALLVVPAEGMSILRLAAANADDHDGNGTLNVLCSTGGEQAENFIQLETLTTTEQWADFECSLPDGTEYVAISKQSGVPAQYVDALRLFASEPETQVYGFSVWRDGTKLTPEPVQGICYTDHNLTPGSYDYQVSLTTVTAAESEPTEPITVNVDYDNGGQAPTNFRASLQDDGSVALSWQAPALGEPIYLRWHSGVNYDAGGLPSGGAFFGGARWYAADLEAYQSLTLTNVEFFVNQVPEALYVLVYRGRTLMRQQRVASLQQYSFNNVRLNEPLSIEAGYDYIVAVYVEHNEITVPLGYDAGPAREGRGNLYSTDGSTWSLLSDDDTGIDANWNISIGLSPYTNASTTAAAEAKEQRAALVTMTGSEGKRPVAVESDGQTASSVNAFMGYNVYRNRTKLNDAILSDTSYLDTETGTARYLEYQVAAVYSASGESLSDVVTIVTSGINAATGRAFTVSASRDAINVSGADADCKAALWTADGKLLFSGKTTGDGSLTIRTALTAGTYILRVGTETVKIAR